MTPPVRICVFGTESTGKSTLARLLGGHFRSPWVPEYSRTYFEEVNPHLTAADAPRILAGQAAAEDAAAAACTAPLLFLDTNTLCSIVWCDLLYGGCPAPMREQAESRARDCALYLLCEADVPFVPDASRCFPDPAERQRAARQWEDALVRLNLPFARIRGADWDFRLRLAIRAVEPYV